MISAKELRSEYFKANGRVDDLLYLIDLRLKDAAKAGDTSTTIYTSIDNKVISNVVLTKLTDLGYSCFYDTTDGALTVSF